MNTLRKLLFLLVFVAITISTCSPPDGSTRDLSSPSKIIVGHWRSPEDWPLEYGLELYIGNFDENNNARCLINVKPDGETRPYGELTPFRCHIYKEIENNLLIGIFMEDGTFYDQHPFSPANDGQTMIFDDDVPLEYIDSNTEP